MKNDFSFGANKSPFDIRTFTYVPDKANIKGGERWLPEDIDHQHKVGICTAISTTMRAQKNYGVKFSPEFQYLCQKKFFDLNWEEGSSIFHALKVGKNIGFLPLSEWKHTTENDRYLPYHEYIEKLKAIPDSEIERLKNIASKYKLKAYASVPVTRDNVANAIDSSGALLVRFVIGEEWWTALNGKASWEQVDIEPLRAPKIAIGGHAANDTNYNGYSNRIANSWGTTWADKGTAYFLFNNYKPTEAWSVWFEEIPKVIEQQIETRESVVGKIMDLIQQLIVLINKLK